MDSACNCIPAGKTQFPRKTWTAISYEHLDRDFIIASRKDAAVCRYHVARSAASLLPKIATGRSIRSAKKLWEDFERVEVRSRIQNESEKPQETPPITSPKNPHGLYKQKVASIKPYRILHGQLETGRAQHDLRRQLYAQVTYLSNAVRNCDGSASYRGMCKRQRGYRTDQNTTSRLHWPSSDDTVPLPRLLLPVTPGTNTKWYSWTVEVPKQVSSPGARQRTRAQKRFAVSAPASQSLNFLEQYGKSTKNDRGTCRLYRSPTKSWDDSTSVHTVDKTENTVAKQDLNKFKLIDEGITGKSIFLTQPETRKIESVGVVPDDTLMRFHGDQEKEKKGIGNDDKGLSDHGEAAEKDGMPDSAQDASLKDEMVPIAKENQVDAKDLPSSENTGPLQEQIDKSENPDNFKTSVEVPVTDTTNDDEICESSFRNSPEINVADEPLPKLQSPVTMSTEYANEEEQVTNGKPVYTSEECEAENVDCDTESDKLLSDTGNLSKSSEILEANMETLSISNDTIDDKKDISEDVTQETTCTDNEI